jgi:hypothetical protein
MGPRSPPNDQRQSPKNVPSMIPPPEPGRPNRQYSRWTEPYLEFLAESPGYGRTLHVVHVQPGITETINYCRDLDPKPEAG